MRSNDRRPGLVRLWIPSNRADCNLAVPQSLKAAILSGLLFIVGCGPEFSSQNRDGKGVQATNPHGEIQENKITAASIKIIGQEPHLYRAEITWPEGLEHVSILLNKKVVFETTEKSKLSHNLDLKDNTEYIVRLQAQKAPAADPHILNEWVVQTPTDVVLSNREIDSVLNNQTKINIQAHRVFVPSMLGDNSSLLTQARDFIINTEELIAENSTITTFQKDQKAAIDQHGRNGGSIIIKATRAIGNLSFSLRGENGGEGKDGENFVNRAPNGADGTAADYNFRCSGQNEKVCTCNSSTSDRENGKPGQKGAPGRDGSNGGRGGHSGSVKIEVFEKSPQFFVDIHNQSGIAGTPGKAGLPQKGGLGGKAWIPPNNPWVTYVCNSRIPGRDGDNGDPGKDGVQQPNGTLEANCVSIGEGFGRCSQ